MKFRTIGMAAALIALPVVAYFEGKENRAYLDPVNVVTICYGHTKTAKIGQVLSDAECERLLQEDLTHALGIVDKYVTFPISDSQRAAFASFTYNLGEGNLRRSTLLKKANRGDLIGACNELPKWVYAGGKKLNGLVRRREAERQLCMEGL